MSRPLRSLCGWALVVLGAAAALVVVGGTSRAQTGEVVDDEARGEQVYAVTCAACHGPRGEGRPGEGLAAGPPVAGLEAAYVDQLMRTGRMPIRADRLGVNREELTDTERTAALEWMTAELGLVGEIPTVRPGERARGHELYGIYCAACHGATGQGGIGAEGTQILGVTGLDAVAVVEAIRVGPFDMPRFDPDVLSEADTDAIATYVTEDLSNPPRTPLGLGEMHRVTFWGLASVLGFVLLGVVVLVSRPVPMPTTDGQERS